jgi:putative ABC transport system substrate-binding protein
MDRRTLLTWTLCLGAFGASRAQPALPRGAKKRLAVLIFDRPETWDFFPPELRSELGALGWIEGKNLETQWRYANGDAALLRDLAAQMVASAPDAILTRGTPATHALQQATRSIPILTGVGDPVGFGFAKTYAAPGGNVTGISWAVVEASEKQVELLRALVPKLALVVVVEQRDRAPFLTEITAPIAAATRAAGLEMRTALVGDEAELRRALQTDRGRGEVGALIYGLGRKIDAKNVADIALAAGVPTMFDSRFYVDAGGLASFRYDWDNQTRRAAAQIDKVFHGESPARIPFELPTRAEFVLNRKTARLLDLQVPQALLVRADAIVE